MLVRVWRLGREVGAVDENIYQSCAGLGPTDIAQLRKEAFPGKSHPRRLHGMKLRDPTGSANTVTGMMSEYSPAKCRH